MVDMYKCLSTKQQEIQTLFCIKPTSQNLNTRENHDINIHDDPSSGHDATAGNMWNKCRP
jgi:hypothetical protein